MNNSCSYELVNKKSWEEILNSLPGPHFLQSGYWAEIKKDNGWDPFFLIWKNDSNQIIAGVMILERRIKVLNLFPIIIHYCPKGPLLNWNDQILMKSVFRGLEEFSKKRKVIFIKIDPDVLLSDVKEENSKKLLSNPSYDLRELLMDRNWIESKEQIQFRNSIYIPLENSEDQLLKNMKQKTRYNIRLSERKGVKVRVGNSSDFEELYKLYAETAIRDNFVIRSKTYYLNVWKKFMNAGLCEPLIAEFEGQILSAVIIYFFANRSYYVYGMSSEINRNLMATYLLQWKAIQRAKQKGCEIYDLWGAPDELDEKDRMWGVYKFKLGFGGNLVKTIGAWDYPINKFGYINYQFVLPKILNIMRKIGFRKTRAEID